MKTRRWFLQSTALTFVAAGGFGCDKPEPAAATPATFELTLSDEEWHKRLSADQFAVLRKAATEPPFTSELLEEHRPGTFVCAGCDLGLFASETKFDSGTGWPSFWTTIKDAVGQTDDRSLGMVRSAVHCHRCGGHLGHVFDDGPAPTGLRYCINGVALAFKAQAA